MLSILPTLGKLTAFVVAFGPGTTSIAPDARPAAGFVIDTLAAGIYAVIRKEPPAYGMESNSLIVVGKRGVAVVDAQINRSDTRAVIAAIRKLTPLPVRYVINTHCHDDHVTGNVEYRTAFPGVEFVASDSMRVEMDGTCAVNRAGFLKAGPGTVKFLRSQVARNQSLLGGPLEEDERIAHLSYAHLLETFVAQADPVPVHPTITFADRLHLDLGGKAIDVMWLGRGHSAGDAIVHLPQDGIVAAGDLVVWPVPFVGTTSHPGEFAVAIDKLIALRAIAIIPGHGPLLRDPAYLQDVSRMLHSIQAQVAASVAHGDTLAQTQAHVDLAEFRALFGGNSKLRRGLFDNYVASSAIPAEFRDASLKKP